MAYWYHKACLVIWPRSFAVKIALSAGLGSAVNLGRRCLQNTAEDARATNAKTLMEIWAFAKPQSAPPSSPTQLCQLEVSLKLCFRHIFNEDKLNKFRKSLCPFI